MKHINSLLAVALIIVSVFCAYLMQTTIDKESRLKEMTVSAWNCRDNREELIETMCNLSANCTFDGIMAIWEQKVKIYGGDNEHN